MKPNLAKLFEKRVNPSTVQYLLNGIFTAVTTVQRQEAFFNFQFNCYDNNQLRLVVRYGWSPEKDRWFFEPVGAK